MVLFVNACARPESRTLMLAQKALQTISESFETLNLFEEDIQPLDYEALLKRDESINKSDYSGPEFRYAKQLREADEIVIAAPYWDLSFPAVLKCYIERICVNGLTFFYNKKGSPEGLCKANRLIYVTTAGGYIPEDNYGYNYVKQLFTGLFGINNTVYLKAEGLDIYGADIDGIMKSAMCKAESLLK